MAAALTASAISSALAANGLATIVSNILDSIQRCSDNSADCGELAYYIKHVTEQCKQLPEKYIASAELPLVRLLASLVSAGKFAARYSRYWRIYRWARADHIRVRFARHFAAIDRWSAAVFKTAVASRFITHIVPSCSDSDNNATSSDLVSV